VSQQSHEESPVGVRYLSCGDTAFTVEFGNETSPEINGRVMALHEAIGRAKKAGGLGGVVETVPTMRSLMVSYSAQDLARQPRARDRRLDRTQPAGGHGESAGLHPLLLRRS
jgi:allophanate hydrolase subunit 1